MKLAYPVATPEVRAPILGLDGRPEEMLPRLRDAGYEAIEPFVADPAKFDVAAWERTVERSGLAVVAVGTGPLVFDDQLSFTAIGETARRAAIARTCAVIEFAARFGAQVNIGKLRGAVAAKGGDAARSWRWMREALAGVSDVAARCGVILTLEPQAHSIIDNLNTTADALAFLADFARADLCLLLDTFHLDAEAEDPAAAITAVAARGVLRHVHFADRGRRVPGDGGIDFPAAIAALRRAGYDRAVTVEVKQEPDGLTAARRAAEFLRPLLSRP